MNAVAYRPEPSARAWHEFSQRAQLVDVAVMEEAKRIASKEGIDYMDAKDRVLCEMYAREQGPCEVITNYAHRRGE